MGSTENQRAVELRAVREKRKADGLCPRCGKAVPEPGHASCAACLEKEAARIRRLTAERREWGVCTKCGRKLYTGHKKCEICRARDSAYNDRRAAGLSEEEKRARNKATAMRNKALRDRREAEGRCVMCGKENPDTRYKRCPECRLMERRRCREQWRKTHAPALPRGEWADHGMCTKCKSPVEEGRRLCARCYEKSCAGLVKARDEKYANRIIMEVTGW